MKRSTRERLQNYFRAPAVIHNSWIDIYRSWPGINLILLLVCLICLILIGTGVEINAHVVWPLGLVAIISILGEILHFLFKA